MNELRLNCEVARFDRKPASCPYSKEMNSCVGMAERRGLIVQGAADEAAGRGIVAFAVPGCESNEIVGAVRCIVAGGTGM